MTLNVRTSVYSKSLILALFRSSYNSAVMYMSAWMYMERVTHEWVHDLIYACACIHPYARTRTYLWVPRDIRRHYHDTRCSGAASPPASTWSNGDELHTCLKQWSLTSLNNWHTPTCWDIHTHTHYTHAISAVIQEYSDLDWRSTLTSTLALLCLRNFGLAIWCWHIHV